MQVSECCVTGYGGGWLWVLPEAPAPSGGQRAWPTRDCHFAFCSHLVTSDKNNPGVLFPLWLLFIYLGFIYLKFYFLKFFSLIEKELFFTMYLIYSPLRQGLYKALALPELTL